MAETDQKERENEEDAIAESESSALATASGPDELEGEPGVAAAHLGERRFVYGAYFAGGIAIAFIMSKALHAIWVKLSLWKPQVGEPRDEVLFAVSGLVGIVAAVYYWRHTRARQLAEEVAQELAKVTWPSKQEVTNSTAVVLITTAVATVFFALMDRFWGFITNFVYGI